GVGIDRQRRIGIERAVRHAGLADRFHERAGVVGVAGAEVGEAAAWVVAAGRPHRRAAALLHRHAVPAVAAGCARLRDGVDAPGDATGLFVEADDLGPARFGADAGADGAHHHLALGHERPAADLLAHLRVANHLIPD